MSGTKAVSKSAAIFDDYASVLSLMRTSTKQQCDLGNSRVRDFYEALEVAWTAAMLVCMEANAARQMDAADAA